MMTEDNQTYVKGYKDGAKDKQKDVLKLIDEVKNPYPEDIFLPVSKGEYTAIHNLLLKHFNIPLDRVSADLMRRARNTLKEELKSQLKIGDFYG